MTIPADDALRYPVGRVAFPETYTAEHVQDALSVLRELPAQVRALVTGLTSAQLATPYRLGGWTVKQVVHHMADSHMNGYLRIKLGITAPGTTIVPYAEKLWAELTDATQDDLSPSLLILDGVHRRMVQVLESLSLAQLHTLHYNHPESGTFPLVKFMWMYRWHSLHHLGHIRLALGKA